MLLALHTIQNIESILRESSPGLFPWVSAFNTPKTFRDYTTGVLFSIRGPLLAFFAGALAIPLALLFYKSGITKDCGKAITTLIAVVLSLAVLLGAFRYSWKMAQPRLQAIDNAETNKLADVCD